MGPQKAFYLGDTVKNTFHHNIANSTECGSENIKARSVMLL
jgi:hypothetical protein